MLEDFKIVLAMFRPITVCLSVRPFKSDQSCNFVSHKWDDYKLVIVVDYKEKVCCTQNFGPKLTD